MALVKLPWLLRLYSLILCCEVEQHSFLSKGANAWLLAPQRESDSLSLGTKASVRQGWHPPEAPRSGSPVVPFWRRLSTPGWRCPLVEGNDLLTKAVKHFHRVDPPPETECSAVWGCGFHPQHGGVGMRTSLVLQKHGVCTYNSIIWVAETGGLWVGACMGWRLL